MTSPGASAGILLGPGAFYRYTSTFDWLMTHVSQLLQLQQKASNTSSAGPCSCDALFSSALQKKKTYIATY